MQQKIWRSSINFRVTIGSKHRDDITRPLMSLRTRIKVRKRGWNGEEPAIVWHIPTAVCPRGEATPHQQCQYQSVKTEERKEEENSSVEIRAWCRRYRSAAAAGALDSCRRGRPHKVTILQNIVEQTSPREGGKMARARRRQRHAGDKVRQWNLISFSVLTPVCAFFLGHGDDSGDDDDDVDDDAGVSRELWCKRLSSSSGK